ncbi:CPBP family intramembrane glutamic endopeptidase [Rhodohalobacter mucosus]|uniref:CPBP family intramembrane glutamic endopeptidase n=1 Tax=Rhodohalobacter mucosus TaxID=2079485 RepID=UPI001FA92623|nr:CPBP family intramembrane glutamic endopeptidase [Rhodohalobacter mucosus]
MNPISAYHRESGSLLYSYLISLPLLLLYEVLIILSQPNPDYLVRISVDAWFKSLFASFGLHTITATLLVAAVAGGVILYRQRSELASVKSRYFWFMIAESFIYAVVISLVISQFLGFLLNISADSALAGMSKLQLIALSLGAGLYEELFFRVILVGLLVFIFKRYLKSKNTTYALSAILAALMFSTVHYIGQMGDSFELGSFLFRFLFGLALNVVYVIRGFGMAAWTHALYDLIVIMRM